tara:strand:+ start:7659 stop:8063 length:405 start_codon:yes stop_codon:yes gene_type:complete
MTTFAKIYYTTNDTFCEFIGGDTPPTIADLDNTHSLVDCAQGSFGHNLEGADDIERMDNLYNSHQGVHWLRAKLGISGSDDAIVRGLMDSMNIGHASMSVGDVIELRVGYDVDKMEAIREYYAVADFGFTKLEA